ncbi:glycosyltransferase family 2 protein [Ureibacillus thermosphaericus]|uniref:Glycosyltransferase involved in cell wall biosynthesis n=2 Tax=Ureibacillus TaxID=160795 RepID=A0A840PZY5_URETH|nr:glycosyltransferase family 2 protein [Ureibacillus thermosphaericus]MBB5149788.1 glycosyltransferase involved in cell wall biosynthesis [Ureibacillus thermosphaericus]
MSSPSISLCMIVKDEADFIEQCLKSVQKIVQEIIIVDTGSTDKTIDICKKYNATVFSYAWNDHFAEARNFALSKATGNWILWLDADEELETGHEQLLMEVLKNSTTTMYLMPVMNYYGESFPVDREKAFIYYQPRLFQNHKGIQFYNRIHETPIFPNPHDSSYTTDYLEIPIHHYGYIDKLTTKRNKAERNLQLIQEEYKNPNHSPWIEYHLANEYYRRGDYNKAFDYLNESIFRFLLNGIKPPSILYRLKYGILVDTNSLDNALEGIEKAIALYPDYVDLHFLRGLIFYQTNNYEEALACFEKCLELGEHNSKYLILKGTGSFKAEHYKQLCLEKLRQSQKQ